MLRAFGQSNGFWDVSNAMQVLPHVLVFSKRSLIFQDNRQAPCVSGTIFRLLPFCLHRRPQVATIEGVAKDDQVTKYGHICTSSPQKLEIQPCHCTATEAYLRAALEMFWCDIFGLGILWDDCKWPISSLCLVQIVKTYPRIFKLSHQDEEDFD